jgi:hypothetical protein
MFAAAHTEDGENVTNVPAQNVPSSSSSAEQIQQPTCRLIHSPAQWYRALQYMHDGRDSFIFYNYDRTIRFMIRADEEHADKKDPDSMYFDICIMNEKDSDMDPVHFEEILKMDPLGYFEDTDETMYYVDTFYILRKDADLTSQQTLDAMQQIERAYAIRPCGCGSYLIKDPSFTQKVCYMCMFAKTEQDLHPIFCPICMEDGPFCHMKSMDCCKQKVHKTCLATWLRDKESRTCPLCRQFTG